MSAPVWARHDEPTQQRIVRRWIEIRGDKAMTKLEFCATNGISASKLEAWIARWATDAAGRAK